MEDQSHKPHRKSKEKKKHVGDHNPKAYSVHRPGKLQRQAARSHDIKEKRLHVPLVDRAPDVEPPPKLVCIVGPPGCGKTTLLKSLVRRYAKETLSQPQGPITVVTSRKQRLTFLECPNELEAMVDIAKIADIVLLMIDGNFGFEMEVMEFLNILTVTGMPGNVFGVLTHLDLFKRPSALRDAKKRLKQRLWSELYHGAHLFYLSGVLNGRYPDREIHNLSRFISVMKSPRPIIFRNQHCYSVIDSFRDITSPVKIEQDEKCDRTIALSGYLRGTNFASQNQRCHIPGLGDFTISSVEVLPDPCPTPAQEQAAARATGKSGRRRLDQKDKKIHAPMSDRTGLKIEGDAIWITRERGFDLDRNAQDVERGEGEELIVGLQAERKLLGQTSDGVQLFRGGEELIDVQEEDTGRKAHRTARFAERDEDEDEIPEDEGFVSGNDDVASGEETVFDERKLGKLFRHESEKDAGTDDVAFEDSDSDLGSLSGDDEIDNDYDNEEETALRWKENLAEKATLSHGSRTSYRTADLARLMYDETLTASEVLRRWKGEVEAEPEDVEDSGDEDFFQKSKFDKDDEASEDRSIPIYDYAALAAKWSVEDNLEMLRQRFSTTTLNGGEDEDGLPGSDQVNDDDEGDGAFEDLETGEQQRTPPNPESEPAESLEAEREKNARRKAELKARFEVEDREGNQNDKAIARREGHNDELGDETWYDTQKGLIQKQLDINNAEFEGLDERQRIAAEGYKAGKYAVIKITGIPCEFVENFQARMPIIVGGLAPTEDRFGFLQLRIKKHRWHKRILKNNDPLIFSLGWRRFQSCPVYSTSDSRTRNRMLKYTPEHSFCTATIWGPLIVPNTSFACFQSFSSANAGFRISATGTVLSVDESADIVKKLRLTGTPYKIFKNTAFLKGMFNSPLEIARFQGGQIKHALARPNGCLRATFEDKILMSDIVFLRAWYPVKPHRFYNPVTNLLGWTSMRLTGEVRRDQGIPTPQDRNSQYRKIERPARHFNPLKVPRALAAELPFKSQIVQMKPQRHKTYMQKRAVVLGGEEKRARDLMQKLTTIRQDVTAKRRAKKDENREAFKKKMAEMGEKKEARERKEKQDFWRREGKKRKGADDAAGSGGKRRRR